MATDSVPALAEPTIAREALRRSAPLRRLAGAVANPALRRGVLAVVDQAITSGTSFATSVIIGRACTQADLGVYYLALSIVLFARAVQGDAVSAPYMIYCSRRRGEALHTYSGSTLIHQLALTLLTMVALAALAGVFFLGAGPVSLLPTLWVLLGATPFLLLREYVRNVSFAHLQVGMALALDVAVAVLQLGGLLALWYWDALSVERVYVVMGVCCAIACGGWFLRGAQPLRFNLLDVLVDWRDNWSFAKWTLAGQTLNRAAAFLMPWIVAAVHGEAATGVLAACITVVNLAGTFVTGVSNLLTPEAAHAYVRGGATALRRVLWQAAVIFLITVGGFCLAVLFFGDWLAVFIFGSQFAGSGPTLTLLAFAMLFNSLALTAGNGLWALDLPRANFAADVCVLAVTMAVVVILVYPLGVLGAAVAILAGAAVGVVVRTVTLAQLLGDR